jgi:2-amino-4-hydroxy-6-hydroxymethyldihydropteridine diphosphokinase
VSDPPPKTVPVALGLGANLGTTEATLAWAVGALAAALGELEVGDLYRSAPESGGPGPDFWNTAVVGRTDLPAAEVLAIAKALERLAGRRPAPRGAPRPLDIDLLIRGEDTYEGPELTVPHPALRRRAFVLAPLADVAPGLAVPPDGATVAELLACLDPRGLVRVGWSAGAPPPAAGPPRPGILRPR